MMRAATTFQASSLGPVLQVAVLLGAALAAGCVGDHSGASDETEHDSDLGEPSEDASNPGDAAGNPDDAASNPSDAAGNPRDGGFDAGAQTDASDDRLQPFEVNRRWTYTRSLLDPARDGGCTAPLESFIAGTVQMDAQVGWDYHPTCSDTFSVHMFMNGDDIWGFSTTNPSRIDYAKAPVQDGAMWQAGASAYSWREEGSVQVPAGRFDRCFRRVPAGVTDGFIVLCRGVGLVIVHAATENYRLELASKTF